MRTYLRHRIWNVLDVKELVALEYLDFEGKYRNYDERHDFWELCYVERGLVTLQSEGREQGLSEGELVLIAPNCNHSYLSPKGNESRAFVVCFACSSQAVRPLSGIRFSVDGAVKDALSIILDESRQTFRMNEEGHIEVLPSPNFGGQQAILLQLEYLLICLLRRLSKEKNAGVVFLRKEQFYADLAEVVTDYFRYHIRERLSLSDICSKMNYSPSFLCKTFKEQTGETLMSFFNRLKMEEARRLLDETSWTVTQIAAYLGFSEVKYFGVLFQRYMNISASSYRKAKAEGGKAKEERV